MASSNDMARVLKELRIRVIMENGETLYIVNSEVSGKRHQPKFCDLKTAVDYARHRDECTARGESPMSGPDYAKAMKTIGASALPAASKESLVAVLLSRFTAVVEDSQQDVNVLAEFLAQFETDLVPSMVTPEITARLPVWLQEHRYSRGHANRVIRTADRAWDMFMGMGEADRNYWKGLKAKKSESDLDRRGRARIGAKASAFGASTMVAVAHLLRPCYLLAFWLVALLGLRRSEAMGLRLGDWTPELRRLCITGQRKASHRKGRSPTKTPSGVRSIVVPSALASAIDRYIAAVHGAAPDSAIELEEWANRYLLVGVQGGPMNSSSFMDALKTAYAELGLTPDRIGRFRPVHHWRKSLGGRLQQGKKALSGPAVAELLGHEHASRNDNDMPAVTLKHYNPMKNGALARVYNELERWTVKKLLPRIESGDLLQLNELDDPISLSEATRVLRKVRSEACEDDIRELVKSGLLPTRKVNHGNAFQTVLVDRRILEELISQTVREQSDTYSAAEVSELLACDREVIFSRLIPNGIVTEVTTNARTRRRSTRGSGSLPGGGRRFAKAEIDALVLEEVEAIERRRTWLSAGEAATLLGVSPDTVRRKLPEHEWRDPWSTHKRRLYDPFTVEALVAELREITVTDAAQQLGTNPARVRALVKLQTIRRGRNKAHVRAIDVQRLIDSAEVGDTA